MGRVLLVYSSKFRQPKIGHFGYQIVSKQDVVAFDITMDDSWGALIMQIFNSCTNREVSPYNLVDERGI